MFTSHVIGNLGADAEVVNSNGRKFITLSIAETRKFKTQEGPEQSQTTWIDAIINNEDHPILPYLKQGVKVAVYGNVSLRVYSSKKDRMMKAGVTIHVLSIELCGGSSDDVPRQLIDPATSEILDVTKHYWVNRIDKKMKADERYKLIDKKGQAFNVDKNGFVTPVVQATQKEANVEPNSEEQK